MQPQLPRLNRGSWKGLEAYVRKQVKESEMEAYLYAGCLGDQGRLKKQSDGTGELLENST